MMNDTTQFMKPSHTFRIGSSAFFGGMDGYASKDNDYICIVDRYMFDDWSNSKNVKLGADDIFIYRDLDKDGFINDALSSGVPMRVGKFLVPEFAEYLGMDINDLRRLKPMVEKLDDKHRYEKVIYDSYLENGSFSLTNEQRERAYEEYRRCR